MEYIHLVRPYLDSLTTRELARLADSYGIDIPPCLERIFIIEELLDHARAEEEGEGEDGGLAEAPYYLETAPIPRQYNITFIDVMVRDPLWAFVFWEIKEHDRALFEKESEFSGYCLRVIPAGQGGCAPDRSYTVQVDAGDTARYLGFSDYPPEGRQGEGGFRVELYVGMGGKSEVLAVSRVFYLPKLPNQAVLHENAEISRSSLPFLSGANDFRILRNMDRQPYLRCSCGGS
jgi:hypothetical protein